jgi:hypothetical protein
VIFRGFVKQSKDIQRGNAQLVRQNITSIWSFLKSVFVIQFSDRLTPPALNRMSKNDLSLAGQIYLADVFITSLSLHICYSLHRQGKLICKTTRCIVRVSSHCESRETFLLARLYLPNRGQGYCRWHRGKSYSRNYHSKESSRYIGSR